MIDKEKPAVATATAPAPTAAPTTPGTVPPKRSPGHRGADVKDTVAEMAAKAHEISLEAGSKMAAAMKDVIGAAAGLTGLVIESARDLLQYMVRRGQMTQEEADKLMREVEASHAKRKPQTAPPSPLMRAATPTVSAPPTVSARPAPAAPAKQIAPKHAAHGAHATHAAPAKKPAAKKPTMKPAAKKHPVKAAAKSKPKASGKTAKRR
jgi:polyhydroxyalkanoate synthesis regulator phasin